MPHFAVVVPPYIGHLRPMSVLAHALIRRGHRVTILSLHDSEPWLDQAGLDFIIYGKAGFPPGEWNRRTALNGQLAGRRAAVSAINLMVDQARLLVHELPPLLAQLKVDGLLMDQICYGTECVAAKMNLPLAIACNALPLHHESGVPPYSKSWPHNPAWWARVRNVAATGLDLLPGFRMYFLLLRYRRSVGLPRPKLDEFDELPPSLAQVSQLPECLDFPRRALPDHFHYTGPWHEPGEASGNDFPWARLDGRPLIYASLGTLQNRLNYVYLFIAEACAGLDAQLVLALGRKDGRPPPEGFSGAPIVVNFAPQVELLKRASIVITHAGLNTTLETLRAGVPMVCVPITNDQPGIAARVQHIGAGRLIPIQRLSAARLREVIQQVRADPGFRERAQRVASILEKLNGPERAAEIVEAALVNRRRVLRATWDLTQVTGNV